MDLKGKFLDINKAAETLSGYTRKEALGKDFRELNLFTLKQIPKVLMLLGKIAMGKNVGPEELTSRRKDGVDVEIEIRGFPVTIENKKQALGVAADITKRKRMEDALKTAKNELEVKVMERTTELESAVELLKVESNDRRKAKEKLLEAEKKLKLRAEELVESNSALRVLLKQREKDQEEFENNILSNIKHLIMPYVEKIKKGRTISEEIANINLIESNLNEIISPFSAKLSFQYYNFTPKEIMIADLIKDGKQDKEILEILNISLDTIKTHRRNIRKKLGINNKKINLRTKLLSLS
jgi:PAS domain S-box-containing protein